MISEYLQAKGSATVVKYEYKGDYYLVGTETDRGERQGPEVPDKSSDFRQRAACLDINFKVTRACGRRSIVHIRFLSTVE
jgi:hypothetical protein